MEKCSRHSSPTTYEIIAADGFTYTIHTILNYPDNECIGDGQYRGCTGGVRPRELSCTMHIINVFPPIYILLE